MGSGCSIPGCKTITCVKMRCGHYVCPYHARQQVPPNCHEYNILKCNACGANKTIGKIWYPCGCIETQIQRFKAYTIIENNCIKVRGFECKNNHMIKIEDYFFYNDESAQFLVSDLLIAFQESNEADSGSIKIEVEVGKVIATILNTNTSLTSLNLRYNNIGDEDAKAIAKTLETNTCLKSLDLDSNKIGVEGAKAIAKALITNNSLTSLNLRYNNIGDEGSKVIAKTLETNTSLKSLNLDSNKIGDEGAKAIAKALEANTSLTSLNLDWNNIGVEGAKVIAKALEKNTSLTSLNLDLNHIRDEGAKSISKILETNTSLTFLNLQNNYIEVEGAKAIAKALETNASLTSVNLNSNCIGVEGAKAIAKALEANHSLSSLNLNLTNIGDEGAKVIAKALETNTSLTSLNLDFNFIGVEGAKVIAKALETNTSLTSLNLIYNNIGVEQQMIIKALLERNKKKPTEKKEAKTQTIHKENKKDIPEIKKEVKKDEEKKQTMHKENKKDIPETKKEEMKDEEKKEAKTQTFRKENKKIMQEIKTEEKKEEKKAKKKEAKKQTIYKENKKVMPETKNEVKKEEEKKKEETKKIIKEEEKENFIQQQFLSLLVKRKKAIKIENAFGADYFTEIFKGKSGKIINITKRTYLIEYTNGERNILKTYEFQADDDDEKNAIESVRNEYNISVKFASLSQNIVKGIDIREVEVNNKLYIEILFEYGGINLFDLAMNYDIPSRTILDCAKQSSAGFAKVEELGIFHSDIKPNNMVWQNNILKIIDFGSSISMKSKEELLHTTMSKMKSGTEVYLSPEIIRNFDELYDFKFNHNKADVYSWGMTFYVIITKVSLDELIEDRDKYKKGDEKDYEGFMKKVRNIKMAGADGAVLQEYFRSILLGALDFEPRNRPTFKLLNLIISNVQLP